MHDKVVDFGCSCLVGKPSVTFEHEDAVFMYRRYTLDFLDGLTFEQCVVIPTIEVILVDDFSSRFIGVDFVAEREDDDKIGRAARRYGLLKNRKTVGVLNTRSNALSENEQGQVNSYVTVFHGPIIILC